MLPRSAAAATEQTQHQHPTSTAAHSTFRSRLKRSSRRVCCSPFLREKIGSAGLVARTLWRGPRRFCQARRVKLATSRGHQARHTASAAAAVIDGPSLVYMYFGARYLPGSLASPLFAWNSTTLPLAARSFLGGTNPSRCLAGQTKDGRLATRVLPLHAGPIRHPECSGRSSPE